jgi:MFS family permease
MPAPENPTAEGPPSAKSWRAFWIAAAIGALTVLDLSKVNVALPSIEASTGAGPVEVQLIVAGYALTFGLVLVPMGRLGDQVPRRALFIVGLSLFTVTSVICAAAPTPEILVAARLLQGVAAGIQMPQVVGLIQELFQGSARGRAFGYFGATVGVATALGPTIGGLMIALGGPVNGWRLIFWMNVPLCLIAIALVIWALPTTRVRERRGVQLDPLGVLLLGGTVLALMAPFVLTTGTQADEPRRWWLLLAVPPLAAAFAGWESRYASRGREPLVTFGLFRISSFRNGSIILTAYFTGVPAMFLLTTLFVQTGLGQPPVVAGLVSIGFAVASSIGSSISGGLVARWGRKLVVWGLVVVLIGLCALPVVAVLSPPDVAVFFMAGAMLVGGLGGGLVLSPNQTLTLADVSVTQGGLAGSIGQLGQRIGAAIGTAIALALFYSTINGTLGTAPYPIVMHDAYALGMAVAAAFVAAALVAAVIDLAMRNRSAPE